MLIKEIAQAIPVYALSVFKIPKQIFKGIILAMSNYWWVMVLTARGCIG
jgi:hypothetical protein